MINSFVDELKRKKVDISIELFGLSLNQIIGFKNEDSVSIFDATEKLKDNFTFLFLMGEEKDEGGTWSFIFGEIGTSKKIILRTSSVRSPDAMPINAHSISPYFPEARVYENALEAEKWIVFQNPLVLKPSDGEFFIHSVKTTKNSSFLSMEELP